jgi:major membrane immunogen (membrane-anchored lipoprotein)
MFTFKNRTIFALSSSLCTLALLVVLGCSSDDTGLAKRYSVTGTVKYKGEPVPKGSITFEPTSGTGRHATGTIENGSYTLSTSGAEGEGALPGDYKVIIISTGVDMTELAKKSGGLVHQGDADFQKVVKGAKEVVPKKYFRSETSPLKAKVEEKSNTFDFTLED